MSGLNRINISIPGSSATAAAQRDEAIARFVAVFGANYDLYHYGDTNSGMGTWIYYGIGYGFSGGIMTVWTVLCTGMISPPSGSDIAAMADPGAGVYPWTAMGSPPSIRTSGGGGGGFVPAGNNNYYVWNIPGNSSTAVADFTAAVNAVSTALTGPGISSTVTSKYFKYVDAVSGAWQVSFIVFGPGVGFWGTTSTDSVFPNNNILYVVTCAGTPHPPTGSQSPAVTIPAFTQTFTSISGRLNFGPMR